MCSCPKLDGSACHPRCTLLGVKGIFWWKQVFATDISDFMKNTMKSFNFCITAFFFFLVCCVDQGFAFSPSSEPDFVIQKSGNGYTALRPRFGSNMQISKNFFSFGQSSYDFKVDEGDYLIKFGSMSRIHPVSSTFAFKVRSFGHSQYRGRISLGESLILSWKIRIRSPIFMDITCKRVEYPGYISCIYDITNEQLVWIQREGNSFHAWTMRPHVPSEVFPPAQILDGLALMIFQRSMLN